MAKIDTIQERTVQADVRISPSNAAAATLESARISSEVQRQSQSFFEEAKRANQNANFSKAYARATEVYQKRIQERKAQQVDEDGNPTFEHLPNDIRKIGNEVMQEHVASLRDPEVRNRLQIAFGNYSSNQQIASLSEARRQSIDFSRSAVNESIDSLEKQAAQDDPSMIDGHINEAKNILDESLAGGAITAQEHRARLKQFVDTVQVEKVRGELEQDPQAVLDALEGGSTFGLNSKQVRQIKREAQSAVNDQIREQERLAQEEVKRAKLDQHLTSETLEMGVFDGTVGDADILAAFNSGQITIDQTNSLRKAAAAKEKKKKSEEQVFTAIDKDIKASKPLREYTNSQMTKYAYSVINQYEEQTGERMAPQAMALAFKGIQKPVKPLADSLNYQLTQGPDGVEAARAVSYLNDKASIAHSKISSDAQAIAASMEVLEKIGMGGAEALEAARADVLHSDEPILEQRHRDYKQIVKDREDNYSHVADMIADTFDPGWFDDVDGVEPSMVADLINVERAIYMKAGSEEAAEVVMKGLIKRNYSMSSFNGGDFVMYKSPEMMFPDMSSEALQLDLTDTLAGLNLLPEDVIIQHESMTEGGEPGYILKSAETGLAVRDSDGRALYWFPNPEDMIAKDLARREQIREETAVKQKENIPGYIGRERIKTDPFLKGAVR
jgi:hypothetical protein